MFLILDELKDMIKMQGGDAEGIRDIGIAIKTLKKLMIQNQEKKAAQPTYQSRHEDRRKERHIESTEEA